VVVVKWVVEELAGAIRRIGKPKTPGPGGDPVEEGCRGIDSEAETSVRQVSHLERIPSSVEGDMDGPSVEAGTISGFTLCL
jgi:hypothetical protein